MSNLNFLNSNGLVDGKIPKGNPCPFYNKCGKFDNNCPSYEKPKLIDFSCALARGWNLCSNKNEIEN